MKPIGGYFELERSCFYPRPKGVCLNSGSSDSTHELVCRGGDMDIRHYAPGEIMPQEVSNFLSESYDRFPVEIGEVNLTTWPSKLSTYADVFCVCRDDGPLSAALFAYFNTETRVGYVPFICALPECEKGTAYRLHVAFQTEALRRGMTRLHLEVLKHNEHACRFYLRQGYTIVEDRAERNRWLMELVIGGDCNDRM